MILTYPPDFPFRYPFKAAMTPRSYARLFCMPSIGSVHIDFVFQHHAAGVVHLCEAV